MTESIIDLRSDTVTKPTPEMRRAMAEAEVGDDVYGEDPSVNRLEARATAIFEREAALFVPSGTMGNQTAIKVHTQPGQDVICESRAHIYIAEMGMLSAFSGCIPRTLQAPEGILTWKLIEPLVSRGAGFRSATGLIGLENSSNLAGGSVYPREVSDEICDRAHERGIPVHLDAARIFNAATALGCSVVELTRKFNSLMFCLSKGLGAPVGSLLLGSREFIAKARKVRKMLGGGMRQAGMLAAAGLLALEQGPKRLPIDHKNARYLAEGLAKIPGITINPGCVVTNIVFFDVAATGIFSQEVSKRLAARGVLAHALGDAAMRMVTHRDVDRTDCERALHELRDILAAGREAAKSSAR